MSEHLTDNTVSRGDLSDDDIRQRIRSRQTQARALNETNGVYRSMLSTYSKEGLNTRALRAVERDLKRNDIDAVIRDLRDRIFYLTLMRQPIRADDLFGDWAPQVARPNIGMDVWDAEDAGYRAGRDNVDPRDCPYQDGSEQAAAWRSFHRKGRAAKQRELGPDEEMATVTRRRPRRQQLIPGVVRPRGRPRKVELTAVS